jgi:hypothetical protein
MEPCFPSSTQFTSGFETKISSPAAISLEVKRPVPEILEGRICNGTAAVRLLRRYEHSSLSSCIGDAIGF